MTIDEQTAACPSCASLLVGEQSWNLIGACASVGIERGMTTREALGQYLAYAYAHDHDQDGHQPT